MGATKKDRRINAVLSVLLGILCVAWLYPVFMILMNSLKTERAITTTHAYELPNADTFVGLKNYIYGIQEMDFLSSFWYSFIITVSSVALILLCCSMCAWYITRVQGVLSKGMYYLCVFSMIVPFQMVMFTLVKVSNMFNLDNLIGIVFIYVGFGAGLSVFMFTGFIKSIPISLEEAAMIDGCSIMKIYFKVVLPVILPIIMTVAIINIMWIWNDYLLPYLVFGSENKTIFVAIQYLRGGYGAIDLGLMMAMLVLAIIPIVIFYMICQKWIIQGVIAGAVKG